MDAFVQQLAELSRTHVTRAKWVFVSSHAIGRTIGDRIALEGTNWLNLRFVTPLDIALRMGAPFLVERGIEPSEDGLGAALMMRLLLDLPEGSGYFRPLADQPTLAQALWSTVHELRMDGMKSDALVPSAFESAPKHSELRALLGSYEQYLHRHGRGDMAMVYEEALSHPDWCPIQQPDCWTELPHVAWTALQRRLLDRMPGERIIPRALDLPGRSVPRRFRTASTEVVPPEAATNPLAFLTQPSAVPATRIDLFHAGGREAEIEEVFRRILSAGVSLDQVEIACGSDAHVSLVWEKALRHDWPVTLGPGIAAPQTRPGRALLGLCDWIETDFAAGHFRRLLQSGDVDVDANTEGFTVGEAARLLGRAQAGWGRATYGLAVGRLRRDYEARAADPDRSDDDRADARGKAELASRVLAWIERLITSIPEPAANTEVSVQAVVEAALAFLETRAARKNALDHRSATALAGYVAELRALGAFSTSLSAALRFIRERVQSLQVAPERPRPGHLYAGSLTQAGFARRPYVFVVGLEEGRVFPSASEDPILLDAERSALSATLRTSTDRIDEAVYATLARLAGCGTANVTFSYSSRDTREFRETYASWLVLQALRVQQGNAHLSYPDMKRALGEPKSLVPAPRERASSTSGWWVSSVLGAGSVGIGAVTTAFPAVAHGLAAAQARSSREFTEYDGYVPTAGATLDPSANGSAISVTELERAAECPFRHFLKRGLGIRPLDDRERDRDVWFDPLRRGAELHDLYALLLRRCRNSGRRPDQQQDGEWLAAAARARLATLQEEMPAATPEILARESKEFLDDVALFLEEESGDAAATPIGFEVSFGRRLNGDAEPLARSEAVEIDLGKGLKFRFAGRIDRIDKVGPSSFEIIDYKTGGFWRDSWRGVFAGGRRLQHALYGLAAVELLRTTYEKPTVVAGVYRFSSHKGRQERVRIKAPSQAAIAGVLGDLRQLIVKGAFVHAPDVDDCKFCDYKEACDRQVHDQAEVKLQSARLATYRRLAGHA
jgi:ATP-dependent helicase/nuclease subunit B